MFYTYEVINNANGRYYRGVHNSNPLNDGYFGSGKIIKEAIKKYGTKIFSVNIICEHTTAEEAYELESLIVVTNDQDPKSYNLVPGGKGGIGKTISGDKNPMKKAEVRAKFLGDKNIGRQPKERERRRMIMLGKIGSQHPKYGCKLSESSIALLRQPKSEEHKKKIGLAHKGLKKPQARLSCIVCRNTTTPQLLTRDHSDCLGERT